MNRILLSIICFFVSVGIFSQKLATQNFVNSPMFKRANIGVLVKNLDTDNVVAEYRSEKVCVPASTTKLVTTATALEMLSSDFQFKTNIEYDGKIVGKVLRGNLYITGGGDPTLGSKYMGDSLFLEKWISAIQMLGIEKIEGDIVADASIYNEQGISQKWMWEDMGNYYAAATYGLSIFDNTCLVTFRSGESGTLTEIIQKQPDIKSMQISNHVKAAKQGGDKAYFFGAPLDNWRSVYGTIPENKEKFVSKADIANPPLVVAQLLFDEIQKIEIQITGSPKTNFWKSNLSRVPIYSIFSPSLFEICKNINFKSNNHYAEHVYRYLAIADTIDRPDMCVSAQVIKQFWKEKGLDVSGLLQNDGSGLSPVNAISAKFFVDLLEYEKKSSANFDKFYETLPLAGETGTVKRLLKGTRLQGKVHCKSGSLSRVICFAGYVEWKNQTYAFSIMVNNYEGTYVAARAEIEKFLLTIFK